jgi:hypothetical protein
LCVKVIIWRSIISKHKKKSCPFALFKFIRFLVKWDKID